MVSHALSPGIYVSLLCGAPFMLTPESALVLGKQLVKLAIGGTAVGGGEPESKKRSGLIGAEPVKGRGRSGGEFTDAGP